MRLKASPCAPVLARNHVRAGVQCFACVLTAMVIFSPPKVWNAVGVAQANPQFVIVLINLHLFNRWLQKLPLLLLSGHLAAGAVVGAACSLACIYLTYLANVSSYDDTAVKAVVLLLLSGPLIFGFTLLRFKHARLRFGGLIAVLVLAISTSTTYRRPVNAALWEFPVFYSTYAVCASLFGLVIPTIVLPTPSGLLARQKLAKGLRGVGSVLSSTVELVSSEGIALKQGQAGSEAPSEAKQAGTFNGGQLKDLPPDAADGWELTVQLHLAAMAAGDRLQMAMAHIAGARYEVDVYRATRLLPLTPFMLLAVLGRSALSAITMLADLPQAGRWSLECHSLRSQLLEVSSAYERCCDAIAAALEINQPIEESLAALEALGATLRALVDAARAARADPLPGLALTPDYITLDMAIALLTTACSRLRLMCKVLPSALARDQRGACEVAEAAFQRMPPWRGARPFPQPTAAANPAVGGPLLEDGAQQASRAVGGARPADLLGLGSLRESMLLKEGADLGEGPQGLLKLLGAPGQPGGAHDASEVLASLRRRSLVVLQTEAQLPGWHVLLWRWFLGRLGCTAEQVLPAFQMTAAYLIVMAFTIAPSIFDGLGGFTQWAMTIVVVLLEPSTGSMVFKAMLRAAGTLLGVLQGVGVFYLAVLADGFSYANRPPKFIVSSLALSVVCGLNAAAATRLPRTAYLFLTASVTMVAPALPNYSSTREAWRVALWRVANTGVGMGVHLFCIWAIFPVTSGRLLRRQAQMALQKLATAAEVALTSILPQAEEQQGVSGGEDRPPAAPAATMAENQACPLAGRNGAAGGAQRGAAAREGAVPAVHRSVELAALCSGSCGGAPARRAGSPLVAPSPQHAIAPRASPTWRDLAMGQHQQPAIPPFWQSFESSTQERPLPSQQELQQQRERIPAWERWLCPALGCCGPVKLAVGRLWGDSSPVALLQGCEGLLGLQMYMRFYVVGYEGSVTISDMGPLIKSLRYEWQLRPPHRYSQSGAAHVRLLLRGLLNVVSSLASSMDAQRLRRVELLARYREQVDTLVQRLRQCLLELGGLVSRNSSLDRALEALFSLERQLERLLLLVLLLENLPTGQLAQRAAGATSTAGAPSTAAPCAAEVAVLSAFMSALLGFDFLSRQLFQALVHLFWGRHSPEAQLVDRGLERTRRWSVGANLLHRAIQALAAAAAAAAMSEGAGADDSSDGEGVGLGAGSERDEGQVAADEHARLEEGIGGRAEDLRASHAHQS